MSAQLYKKFVSDHFSGHVARPTTVTLRLVVFHKEVNLLLQSLLPILSGFVRRLVSLSEFQFFITSVVNESDRLKHYVQYHMHQKLHGGAKGLFAKLMAGIMVASAMATGQAAPGGYMSSTDQQVQNLHKVSSVFDNEILRLGESEMKLKFASDESTINNPFFGNVPSAQTTPLYLQDHNPDSVEGVLQTVGRKLHLPDNTVVLDYMHFTRIGGQGSSKTKMHNDFDPTSLDDVQTYIDLDKIQEVVPTHLTQFTDFDTIENSASSIERQYLFNEKEGGQYSVSELRSKKDQVRQIRPDLLGILSDSYGPTTLLANSKQDNFNWKEHNIHPSKLQENAYIPQDGENLLAFFRDDFIHGGPRQDRRNFAGAIAMAKFAVPKDGQNVAYDVIPGVYTKYLNELDRRIDSEIAKEKGAEYNHRLETYRKIKHRFLFRKVDGLGIDTYITDFQPPPEAKQFALEKLMNLYKRSGLV